MRPHRIAPVFLLIFSIMLPAQGGLPPLAVSPFPPLSTKEDPFLLQVSRVSLDGLKTLLKSGADRGTRSLTGQSALMIACLYNTPAAVKLLVEGGADVNLPDYSDYTPLMAAAARGDTASMALLLDRGANLEARTRFGDTPLHVALGGLWWIPSGALLPGANVSTSASALTLKPQVEAARLLLKAGADVFATDISGQHLFIKLACRGITNGMDLLAEAGLHVNKRDEASMTALMWAAVYGYTAALRELVRLGADLNAATEEGRTSLDLLRREEPDTIRIVTERGTLTRRLRHPANRAEVIALLESLGAK